MSIKKLLFATLCMVGCTFMNASAADAADFSPYWFLQGQGGVSYSYAGAPFTDLLSPTAALSFGRQFTPIFGTRFQVAGWESKGGWSDPDITYSFKYVAGNIDLMLNMSSLFNGYKKDRKFNVYGFAGVGYNRGWENDEVIDAAIKYERNQNIFYIGPQSIIPGNVNPTYIPSNRLETPSNPIPQYWEKNTFIQTRIGIMLDQKLSERVSVNFEANGNILPDSYNSKDNDAPDFFVNALLGLKVKLGKSKPAPAPAPVYVAPTPAPKPAPAPAPAPRPAPVVEKPKLQHITENIFFDINKSVIKASEQEKVKRLADFLLANPQTRVTVTGYADKNTGNAAINLRISEARAKAVAKELVEKYGVAESRITKDWKGDTEQPFTDDYKLNRAVIGVTND